VWRAAAASVEPKDARPRRTAPKTPCRVAPINRRIAISGSSRSIRTDARTTFRIRPRKSSLHCWRYRLPLRERVPQSLSKNGAALDRAIDQTIAAHLDELRTLFFGPNATPLAFGSRMRY
jgi:hypothetical protein